MDATTRDALAQRTGQEAEGGGEIPQELCGLCREAAADGAVLLKNDDETLPLRTDEPTAVFGRVQLDYFYVGYGSGGDVRAPYTVSLMQGLREAGAAVDEPLAALYEKWCAENPPEMGDWGTWPRSFPEMPVGDELIREAAARCGTALVVIGRAAGESRDNAAEPGSYYLTEDERSLLARVSAAFRRTAVLLDIGGVMDLSWIDEMNVRAVLCAWQGGMESGRAAADVLTGRVSPSGRLPDTVARRYEDYPGSADFLGEDFNCYTEDVYVGYRWFETFAKDAVQFPFGFGLSYTTFALSGASVECADGEVRVRVRVTNTGPRAGREVVQAYYAAPQGALGKPARCLAAFRKTELLEPGASQDAELRFAVDSMAGYDDTGASGARFAWVLEAGVYDIYVGADVRSAQRAGAVALERTRVVRQLEQVCPVQVPFARVAAREGKDGVRPDREAVTAGGRVLRERILARMPREIPPTGDRSIRFEDVAAGRARLEDFAAQLTDEDLDALARGDRIMDSPLGAPGNAGVLGGVTPRLRELGVPCATTTDGPSGVRLRRHAALIPCGTALAATWDPALVERLSEEHGAEMIALGSDVLLAPGMNIHRDPLCGRNFEYFSEDPLLTGRMGAAVVRGVQKNGVSACPKHFACNNQETNRSRNDSRVSERALREIYLRGFEICVREAAPRCIMTSYNLVNGVWSHYNYDLCTTVLRGEWGYDGLVMTDWWMQPCTDPDFPALTDSAYRVRAQVDVLMPGATKPMGEEADTAALASHRRPDGLTLAELQRGACNVLRFLLWLGRTRK